MCDLLVQWTEIQEFWKDFCFVFLLLFNIFLLDMSTIDQKIQTQKSVLNWDMKTISDSHVFTYIFNNAVAINITIISCRFRTFIKMI